MKDECRRFVEDPEGEREHALICQECALRLDETDTVDERLGELRSEPRASIADGLASRLPLAPWEGARHRSWGMVAAGAGAIIGLAAALFSLIGVSPAAGFIDAVSGSMSLQMGWVRLFRVAPQLLSEAPLYFHLSLLIAFVSVNFLLYLLLRRDPRGVDAQIR